MGTLERVMGMRQEGKSEAQIIEELKQQGISPKEINDSLSQSDIKSEIASQPLQQPDSMQQPPMQQPPAMQQPPMQQPDLMQDDSPIPQLIVPPAPNPTEIPQSQPMQEQPPQQPPPYESQLMNSTDQVQYQDSPQEYYQEYQQSNVETMNEISEQIFEEKIYDIREKISSFSKFQEGAKTEIDLLTKKINKIEKDLNEMQMAIIRRVGEYGEDIKNISKELKVTQDSFSKVIGKDHRESRPKPKTKSKKGKENFEDYLR